MEPVGTYIVECMASIFWICDYDSGKYPPPPHKHVHTTLWERAGGLATPA